MDRLELRPYGGEDDVTDITRIENAELEADAIPGRGNVGTRVAWYRHPSDMFDPARDVTLAILDGEAVGYAERKWVDTNDGAYREYRLDGAIHPAWRRRGIGGTVLEHNEAVLRQLASGHQTDRKLTFGTWSGDTQPGRIALLERHGYTPVRWFFDMTRPNLNEIDESELPDGLEVRPVTDDLIHQIWHADIEAFRDHWGGGDDSDEALKRYIESPDHDPLLWVIAWDGSEVAGGIINGIDKAENEALGLQRGWLHSVFTRRPWRKRGLARALIGRSLALLRDRGMTSAVLGVDADNPTGALGLYERAGFEVSYRSTAWRKPLDLR